MIGTGGRCYLCGACIGDNQVHYCSGPLYPPYDPNAILNSCYYATHGELELLKQRVAKLEGNETLSNSDIRDIISWLKLHVGPYNTDPDEGDKELDYLLKKLKRMLK